MTLHVRGPRFTSLHRVSQGSLSPVSRVVASQNIELFLAVLLSVAWEAAVLDDTVPLNDLRRQRRYGSRFPE
jgi:hypothetical protein